MLRHVFQRRAPSISAVTATATQIIVTATRHFHFSWQVDELQSTADKKGWTSPVWAAEEDLNWITKTICPLKSGERPLRFRSIPLRLVLWNMKQLKLTEDVLKQLPTGGVENHSSWSTKKSYAASLQFQLEQRVVISNLQNAVAMPADEFLEKSPAALQTAEELGKYAHMFWITPKESVNQRLFPRSDLATTTTTTTSTSETEGKPQQQQPFALITKAQKNLYNASQFAEATAIEKFPISIASGRLIDQFQRQALSDWHTVHLDLLSAENFPSSTTSPLVDYSNRLAIFGLRSDYDELGLKLRSDAVGVKVPREFRNSNLADRAALPHDNDVYHFTDIVNQEALWNNCRFARPVADQAASSSTTATSSSSVSAEAKKPREHYLLPRGTTPVFQSLWEVLDEIVESDPTKTKLVEADRAGNISFWVTRSAVQRLGLQLKEGAKATSSFAKSKKQQEQSSSAGDFATVEYFHVSQCEDPAFAIKKTGLHTR